MFNDRGKSQLKIKFLKRVFFFSSINDIINNNIEIFLMHN